MHFGCTIIWCSMTLPRVKAFCFWTTAPDKIPSPDNLRQRKFALPNMLYVCLWKSHLIKSPFIIYLLISFGIPYCLIFASFLLSLSFFCCSPKADLVAHFQEVRFCGNFYKSQLAWGMWKEKNRTIFKVNYTSLRMLMGEILVWALPSGWKGKEFASTTFFGLLIWVPHSHQKLY